LRGAVLYRRVAPAERLPCASCGRLANRCRHLPEGLRGIRGRAGGAATPQCAIEGEHTHQMPEGRLANVRVVDYSAALCRPLHPPRLRGATLESGDFSERVERGIATMPAGINSPAGDLPFVLAESANATARYLPSWK